MKRSEPLRRLTCIQCPLGCSLKVYREGGEEPGSCNFSRGAVSQAAEAIPASPPKEELVVEGNLCRQGEVYAREEVVNPTRSLTTTVATSFARCPRLPVRTEGEIPLQDLFRAMEEINALRIDQPLKPGDVVLENLLGTGVPLIATGGTHEVCAGLD